MASKKAKKRKGGLFDVTVREIKSKGVIRDGWILLPMDLGMIATSRTARAYVKEHAWCRDWDSRGGKFLARRGGPVPTRAAVDVTMSIGAYMTRDVSEKLRKRTFRVRTFGECLVHAAQMYAKIYREDERLGGESSEQRDKRLALQKKPRAMLRNRGFGPYIWGHDLGDLAFETAHIKWDGTKKCTMTFSIGS